MAVFLGSSGNIRLRRGSKDDYIALPETIEPDDVTTSLNRISFDSALDNLLTGDRLILSTADPRGLICLDSSAWSTNTVQPDISLYINVNAVGGIRFFRDFQDAVNNNRSAEISVYPFTGAPLVVDYTIRDTSINVLGNVTGYTLNTDRDAIDVTSLSDKFRRQYNAGILSGNGSIDCLFDYTTTGISETPLLLLQLIQRLDIGSSFDVVFYLTDKSLNPELTSVFYQTTAIVTRAGVSVSAQDIVECTIDFVTDGEIRLLVGEPTGFTIDNLVLEQSLDYLIEEPDD